MAAPGTLLHGSYSGFVRGVLLFLGDKVHTQVRMVIALTRISQSLEFGNTPFIVMVQLLSYTVSPMLITYTMRTHLHFQVPLSLHSNVRFLLKDLRGLFKTTNLWCTTLGGTISGSIQEYSNNTISFWLIEVSTDA